MLLKNNWVIFIACPLLDLSQNAYLAQFLASSMNCNIYHVVKVKKMFRCHHLLGNSMGRYFQVVLPITRIYHFGCNVLLMEIYLFLLVGINQIGCDAQFMGFFLILSRQINQLGSDVLYLTESNKLDVNVNGEIKSVFTDH